MGSEMCRRDRIGNAQQSMPIPKGPMPTSPRQVRRQRRERAARQHAGNAPLNGTPLGKAPLGNALLASPHPNDPGVRESVVHPSSIVVVDHGRDDQADQ